MAKGIPFQNLSTSSNNKDVYINPIPHPHYNLSTHRNSSILTPQPITSPTLKKKNLHPYTHTHFVPCTFRKSIYAREKLSKEIIGKDSNAEAPYGRNKKDEATKMDEIHACGTETKDHGAKWRRKRKKVDSRAISRQRGEHAPARTIERARGLSGQKRRRKTFSRRRREKIRHGNGTGISISREKEREGQSRRVDAIEKVRNRWVESASAKKGWRIRAEWGGKVAAGRQ